MTAPTLATPAVTPAFPCPDWCDGDCGSASGPSGVTDRYHGSDFTEITGIESVHGDPSPVRFSLSLSRIDHDDEEGPGATEVHLLALDAASMGDDFVFSPATARKVAAALLNLADAADPLPAGVKVIRAEEIRVGDEIETPDGFQHVYMILIDESADHAAAFTDERDDTDSDGWQYTLADMVTVRRAVAR